MADDDAPIIWAFAKNKQEMVAGYIAGFHGKRLVHIRVCVPSAVEDGEWIHTKKGVTIPVDQFNELKAIVAKVWEAAGERIIGTMARNDHERIQIALRLFKGAYYCDIRIYYRDGDEWKPSPKGVAVSTNHLQELEELLEHISARIDSD